MESKRVTLERDLLKKARDMTEQLEKQKMPLRARFWLWLLKKKLKSFK